MAPRAGRHSQGLDIKKLRLPPAQIQTFLSRDQLLAAGRLVDAAAPLHGQVRRDEQLLLAQAPGRR